MSNLTVCTASTIPVVFAAFWPCCEWAAAVRQSESQATDSDSSSPENRCCDEQERRWCDEQERRWRDEQERRWRDEQDWWSRAADPSWWFGKLSAQTKGDNKNLVNYSFII